MTAQPSVPAARAATESARGSQRSLAYSVAWTAAAKWSGQLLTSGITLLVARILTPSDYGLVGMATLFLGFVRFVSDFGIGSAVVARSEFDRHRLAALNTCAVLFGVGGALVTIAAAKPLGWFFKQPALPALAVVMSLSFIISGLRTIPSAALQRDLRFKALAAVDLAQSVVGAVLTLLLALSGARYWALVLGSLLSLALATAALVVLSPHRLGRPDREQLRPAARLSRDLTITNVCWYAYSNADFLVVGKVLGQTALGLYDIGWTLAMLIVERVTTIIGGVTPAYLAAAKDDVGELRRYLLRISASIAFLTFPISIGLSLVADDFCTVVLGPKWVGAIEPLRLLALYAGLRSLTPILPQILIVLEDHRFVARVAVITALVMPLTFWLGSHYGVEGVAMGWVIGYPIVAVPLFMRAFDALHITTSEYTRGLRLPLVSSVVMAAVVLGYRLLSVRMAPPLRLGTSVAVGALAYAASLYIIFGVRLRTIASLVRARASAT